MKEKQIERELVKEVGKHGGICPKFVSPGTNGMPDRLVLLPEGRIGFAETKALGKRPRPIQRKRHRQLRALGFQVFVLDSREKIEEAVEWLTLS